MKVIQIPYCYYPDPLGGTEVYVESLSHHLQKRGISVVVAAPSESNDSFIHKNLPVRKFKVGPVKDPRDLYGEGDEQAAEEFMRILDQEKPNLIHLHALTRGASLKLVREAQSRKIPVIFTYHTPTVSCQRGTLLRWGKEVCDGVLRLHTCSRCTLHGLGLDRLSATLMGSLPPSVGQMIGNMGINGKAGTVFRMSELIALRHRTVLNLMSMVSHIIAPAEWVKKLLILNGVPPEKISLSRQGLCHEDLVLGKVPIEVKESKSGLKIAFMGRLDPTKGLHLLIQAVKEIPDLGLTLDIYGVVQGKSGDTYEKKIYFLAENDSRIQFHAPVPAEEVVPTLKNFDLLAVPSQWLETGPMVILEAFAAGIPVIGSNLGGIAETVKDGVNGRLIEASSVQAWRDALITLHKDRLLLSSLRANVLPPKKMEDVTKEMALCYEQLIAFKTKSTMDKKSKIDTIDISVVIPTYNRDSFLKNTLRDLINQKGNFCFELIVVDQNPEPVRSRDNELYIISQKSFVQWIHSVDTGVVYARNKAISLARGEILVFVDDDVKIDDTEFLSKHLQTHSKIEYGIAAVCGREVNPGKSDYTDHLSYKRGEPIFDVLFFPRNYSKKTKATVLSTANCSVKRKALLEVGGFDENFGRASYGDDADLALRLIEKGHQVLYDPAPALLHLMASDGGLRLSSPKSSSNQLSESEKVISGVIFYLKYIRPRHKELSGYYIFHYILKKSIFLKRNLLRPWRFPIIIGGLFQAVFAARKILGEGHKFSFSKSL